MLRGQAPKVYGGETVLLGTQEKSKVATVVKPGNSFDVELKSGKQRSFGRMIARVPNDGSTRQQRRSVARGQA